MVNQVFTWLKLSTIGTSTPIDSPAIVHSSYK
ncbi:Uncharacterised protein [Vibrio cholerae]|nr:Uncharacterised protein [Vibrio cholerae]